MQWWKVVGAAAFVGVAATGVLVARSERRHHDYTPEEIHERLQARAAEALAGEALGGESLGDEVLGDEAPAPGAEAEAEVLAREGPVADLPAGETLPGESLPGSTEAEVGTPPSKQAAPPADVRRRLATQVNRARTRIGLRRRPTPRRKARAKA